MPAAKSGDTVKVHYTGKLDDGTVFDSSLDGEPLKCKIGTGEIIPGFEEAITGMDPGQSKTVTIPAKDAYGDRSDDFIVKIDRNELPGDVAPQVGQQVKLSLEGGGEALALVTDISDSQVTLDANHPLAGQDLTFEIDLLEIL